MKKQTKERSLDIVEHNADRKVAYADKKSAEWFFDLCKKYEHCYGFDTLSELKEPRANSGYVYEIYTNDVEFMPYDLAEAMGLLE